MFVVRCLKERLFFGASFFYLFTIIRIRYIIYYEKHNIYHITFDKNFCNWGEKMVYKPDYREEY